MGWKLENMFLPSEEWMKSFEGFQGRSCSVCRLGQQKTKLDDPGYPFSSILCLKDSHMKYLQVVSHKRQRVLKKIKREYEIYKEIKF